MLQLLLGCPWMEVTGSEMIDSALGDVVDNCLQKKEKEIQAPNQRRNQYVQNMAPNKIDDKQNGNDDSHIPHTTEASR